MPQSRWLLALLAPMLFASVGLAQGIAVQLPEPSPCPSQQIVEELRVLPRRLVIGEGGAAQPGEVKLTLILSDGHWSMEIIAPDQAPLHRPLAVEEGDCLAVAHTAALVTERYLESINWIGAPGEVSPLPPPPHWQAIVTLGSGAAVGLTGVAPMAQLDVGARYAMWAVELSGAYLGWGQVNLDSATQPAYQNHHTGAIALAVSRRFELGPGAVRAGLAPGIELYRVDSEAAAETPNPLPHRQVVLSPLPFIAALAGYEVNVGNGITVGVRVQVRAHLGSISFITEGYSPAFSTSAFDGDLALAVSFSPF